MYLRNALVCVCMCVLCAPQLSAITLAPCSCTLSLSPSPPLLPLHSLATHQSPPFFMVESWRNYNQFRPYCFCAPSIRSFSLVSCPAGSLPPPLPNPTPHPPRTIDAALLSYLVTSIAIHPSLVQASQHSPQQRPLLRGAPAPTQLPGHLAGSHVRFCTSFDLWRLDIAQTAAYSHLGVSMRNQLAIALPASAAGQRLLAPLVLVLAVVVTTYGSYGSLGCPMTRVRGKASQYLSLQSQVLSEMVCHRPQPPTPSGDSWLAIKRPKKVALPRRQGYEEAPVVACHAIKLTAWPAVRFVI